MAQNPEVEKNNEAFVPLSKRTREAIKNYCDQILWEREVPKEARDWILNNEVRFIERGEAATLMTAAELIEAISESVTRPSEENIKKAEEMWKKWQRNIFRLNPWTPGLQDLGKEVASSRK